MPINKDSLGLSCLCKGDSFLIADAIDDIGDADIALWDEENVEHQARGGQGGDA